MDSQVAARLAKFVAIPPDDAIIPKEPHGAGMRLGGQSEDRAIIKRICSALEDARMALDRVSSSADDFQSEIERLAGDTASLQERSVGLHAKHAVRAAAQARLAPLVTRHVVPSTIVRELIHGCVGTTQWRAALAVALRLAPEPQIASATDSMAEDSTTEQEEDEDNGETDTELSKCPADSGALVRDAEEFTLALLARAAQRAKEFYVSRVRTMRKPGANLASVRKDLAENAPLHSFLRSRYPRLAITLRRAYINTARWYYHMLLGKYLRNIARAPIANVEQTALGSLLASAGAAGAVATRPSILAERGPPISLLQAATPPSGGFTPEVLARAVLESLRVSIAVELDTLSRAFGIPIVENNDNEDDDDDDGENARSRVMDESNDDQPRNSKSLKKCSEEMNKLMTLLFDGPISHGEAVLNKILQHAQTDALGLLLIARLIDIENLQKSAQLSCFSQLCESVGQRARQLLQGAIETHSRAIETAALKPTQLKLSSPSAPHPLTPQLAASLAGLLQLCELPDDAVDGPLAPPLRQISSAYEMFIARAAKQSPVPETTMFNNFFIVATMLSDVRGPLASELAAHFKLLAEIHSQPAK